MSWFHGCSFPFLGAYAASQIYTTIQSHSVEPAVKASFQKDLFVPLLSVPLRLSCSLIAARVYAVSQGSMERRPPCRMDSFLSFFVAILRMEQAQQAGNKSTLLL